MPQMHWYQQLFTRRMLICVFTGFSSGLPLYLLLNLVIVLAMRRVERWLAVPGFVIGGGR